MPVSRLNIAVRRPFGSDVTQAPIIPSSPVKTVLLNPTIKQASNARFSFYSKKREFSVEIRLRRNRRRVPPIFSVPPDPNNRFNRYFSRNLPNFNKILKKTRQKS